VCVDSSSCSQIDKCTQRERERAKPVVWNVLFLLGPGFVCQSIGQVSWVKQREVMGWMDMRRWMARSSRAESCTREKKKNKTLCLNSRPLWRKCFTLSLSLLRQEKSIQLRSWFALTKGSLLFLVSLLSNQKGRNKKKERNPSTGGVSTSYCHVLVTTTTTKLSTTQSTGN
jgi:hypothetical protein